MVAPLLHPLVRPVDDPAIPAFVEKLRTGDASTRSACDHRNYCIARMYSVDMKCCKHCPDLPRKIVEELERLP